MNGRPLSVSPVTKEAMAAAYDRAADDLERRVAEIRAMAEAARDAAAAEDEKSKTTKVRAFYLTGRANRSAIALGGYRLRAPRGAEVGDIFTDPITGRLAQVHRMGWFD